MSPPWLLAIRDQFPFQYIVAEPGNRVIVARMGGDSVEAEPRRIVAAINFATGQTTEWLETHSLAQLVEALMMARTDANKRRVFDEPETWPSKAP